MNNLDVENKQSNIKCDIIVPEETSKIQSDLKGNFCISVIIETFLILTKHFFIAKL